MRREKLVDTIIALGISKERADMAVTIVTNVIREDLKKMDYSFDCPIYDSNEKCPHWATSSYYKCQFCSRAEGHALGIVGLYDMGDPVICAKCNYWTDDGGCSNLTCQPSFMQSVYDFDDFVGHGREPLGLSHNAEIIIEGQD